jgi:hypothetical protein
MDSLRVAILDSQTFLSLWEEATAATQPRPPIPTIDFNNDIVLLVSAGRRNSGDRIRVDSIGFGLGSSTGWFAIVRTIEECNPLSGVAYPLEFVRVAKRAGQIEFIDRLVPCP